MMNLFKTLMRLTHTNKILKKKIEDVDKKIPDTTKFIETQEFNRLKQR